MFALFNLRKPRGVTSRDAVNAVQRLARPHKVGHAGTLDPLAVGVLVVAVGPATRLIERLQAAPKRYVGVFQLGATSPTEDVEGEVTPLVDAPRPTREEVAAVAPRFVGRIEQTPPRFSALKVDGRRAYDLARRGKEFSLAKRPVDIHALSLVAYDYPRMTLAIECGGGTYVRTLGRDVAASLGTDCVMEELTRTAVGGLTIETAVDPFTLTRESLADSALDPLLAVSDLPRGVVDDDEIRALEHGRILPARPEWPGVPEMAMVDSGGKLLAIVSPDASGGWRPGTNFVGK